MKKFFKVGTEIRALFNVYSVRDLLWTKGDCGTVKESSNPSVTLIVDYGPTLVGKASEHHAPVDYTACFEEVVSVPYALAGKKVEVRKSFPGALHVGHVRRIGNELVVVFWVIDAWEVTSLYSAERGIDYTAHVEAV